METYILNFIDNNIGSIIVFDVFIVILAVVAYIKLKNLTKGQRQSILLKALLEMVIIAEGKLGSKTGADKKAMVYAMFKSKFPLLSIILSENLFNSLLDEALDEMKKILEKEILELDTEKNVTNMSELLSTDIADINVQKTIDSTKNTTEQIM